MLDQVEWKCRLRHYSPRTAKAYVYWSRRYILVHGKRHPSEMGAAAVKAFLDSLVDRQLSASSHSQALNALVFLYSDVLEQPFEQLQSLDRPWRPKHLPAVLTRARVAAVLARMRGVEGLMARLIYGTGMRIHECLTLRVKDLLWDAQTIHIHGGKGAKDRMTFLPQSLAPALRAQVLAVAESHRQRQLNGRGYVAMPEALGRKYRAAAQSLRWQFVFPSSVERGMPLPANG